jgi:hypothetical protein
MTPDALSMGDLTLCAASIGYGRMIDPLDILRQPGVYTLLADVRERRHRLEATLERVEDLTAEPLD